MMCVGSRERILSDFRALSYEDQLNQREDWAKELHKTMEEIQGEYCKVLFSNNCAFYA